MDEHNAHPTHGDGAHDDHHGHDGMQASHGTFKSYVIGFVLSVILTAIPFWLVMADVISNPGLTAIIILAFGAVQIFVHMIYFLHMNTKSENGWNMLALIFTLILVFIALAGSIWVMFNLNVHMMPGVMDAPVHTMKGG